MDAGWAGPGGRAQCIYRDNWPKRPAGTLGLCMDMCVGIYIERG